MSADEKLKSDLDEASRKAVSARFEAAEKEIDSLKQRVASLEEILASASFQPARDTFTAPPAPAKKEENTDPDGRLVGAIEWKTGQYGDYADASKYVAVTNLIKARSPPYVMSKDRQWIIFLSQNGQWIKRKPANQKGGQSR